MVGRARQVAASYHACVGRHDKRTRHRIAHSSMRNGGNDGARKSPVAASTSTTRHAASCAVELQPGIF